MILKHKAFKFVNRSSTFLLHCCCVARSTVLTATGTTISIIDKRMASSPSLFVEPSKMEKSDAASTLSKRALKRIKRNEARKTNKKAKKDNPAAGFESEAFNATKYYFENGLRKVYPYYHTWQAYAKGRWIGRSIFDIFCEEFILLTTPEWARHHFSIRAVSVNDVPVSTDYIVKSLDVIHHRTHRHEPPVSEAPLKILHSCDDLLVIDKPSGLPVHPSGRYRYNTVVGILAKEFGYANLRTLHRLDSLTSGVLLFARNTETARRLHNDILERKVEKEYLAKVDGVFPPEPVDCKAPLDVLDAKTGVFYVCDDGKFSHTTFQRVNTDGSTSIVRCFLHTGRTHQIRIHLQYLGYPIVNDRIYNTTAWGLLKGKSADYGLTKEELIQSVRSQHHITRYVIKHPSEEEIRLRLEASKDKSRQNESVTCVSDCIQSTNIDKSSEESQRTSFFESTETDTCNNTCNSSAPESMSFAGNGSVFSRDFKDPDCWDCMVVYREPTPKELVMYLHAHKYRINDMEFVSPLPPWATY